MKRLLMPLAAAFIVGVLPEAALAQAASTNERVVDGVDVTVIECGETTYNATFTYDGVIHSTELPDGRTELNATFTGEIVLEPQDADGPTYQGRSTYTFDLSPGETSFTSTAVIVARGSDGSMLRAFYLIHTTDPTGSGMEVDLQKARCA